MPANICATCEKKFIQNEKSSIGCDICDNWHHQDCIKMDDKTFKYLSKSTSPWFCDKCLTSNFTFKSLEKSMVEEFTKIADNLADSLNGKINVVSDKLQKLEEKVEHFNENHTLEFDKFQSECNYKFNKNQFAIAAMERNARSSNLVVNGIPVVKNENLQGYLLTIAKVIRAELKVNDFTVFRTKSKLQCPVIIVKFYFPHMRKNFYDQYLQFKNLNLAHLNLNSPNRIYFGEHLTQHDAFLMKQARHHMKTNVFIKVYSSNGVVKVVPAGSSRAINIFSDQQLQVIIRNTQQANDFSDHNNTIISSSPNRGAGNNSSMFHDASTSLAEGGGP